MLWPGAHVPGGGCGHSLALLPCEKGAIHSSVANLCVHTSHSGVWVFPKGACLSLWSAERLQKGPGESGDTSCLSRLGRAFQGSLGCSGSLWLDFLQHACLTRLDPEVAGGRGREMPCPPPGALQLFQGIKQKIS